VLHVTLRKREEVKARRIEVKGEAAGAGEPKTIETKAEPQTPAPKGEAKTASGR
jgi:hypothetical protein